MPDASSILITWPHRGGEVALRLKPHPRARRLAVRIDAAGEAVELTMPRRCSRAEALRFLEDNRGWVEKRLDALPPRILFADGAEIPVMDVVHRIRHVGKVRGKGPVWIDAGDIHVTGDPAFLARRVRDFLRALAKEELQRRATAMAEIVDRTVSRVTVRDTTSRWGSCAHNGNLSFCWRLVFTPEGIIDSVVAHEVAHLVHMNHGVRFWQLVERLDPDAKAHKLWLNRNRARLLRIG